jgi:glutamate carboxypeptidase
MASFDRELAWIGDQTTRMESQIERWCSLNSGSRHRAGIESVAAEVIEAYSPLGARLERVELPVFESIDDDGEPQSFETADAILFRKRPEAERQILLAIHLDTVFPPDSPFNRVDRPEPGILHGPGVADAKSGIALIGVALEALERSSAAGSLGWTVILNPDEEIGSPCSRFLLAEEAARADFGLVFEPSLPDGSLISRRKGSGNFTIVVRGRSAHVGRHFREGRSAIHALAALVDEVAGWNDSLPGLIANTGIVRGGTAFNVVPDFALARINLRVEDRAQQAEASRRLAASAQRIGRVHGVDVEIHGDFLSPPKPIDAPMEALMREVETTASQVGAELAWKESGGVCDGNKLAAAGLPNIDTMGPRGGEIHSDREYLLLDSLAPRTRLCAALLYRYAMGEFDVPH